MSALWRGPARRIAGDAPLLVPMTIAQLDAVMAIEVAAYAFPWSRGNFIDSLAAGYPARTLVDARGALLGYFVAMGGVDEMHLLNITVAPAAQGRGYARRMIDALVALCQALPARSLWLEVRASNTHARALYEHLGFVQVGLRKGYYPAPFGRREDAIVMSLAMEPAASGGPDALG
jgi:ribosomal-protein-alanine N-acetyltransferase